MSSHVFAVFTVRRTAAEHEHKADDHEDDSGGEFDDRGPELFFGVTNASKDVDDDNGDPEDGNPDADADVLVPILYDERADCQLERQDDEPEEEVIPTDGETK